MPVRVSECEPKGLLKAIVYIDLVGKDEEEARHALLEGVARRRAKPTSKPDFPGDGHTSAAPVFPGSGNDAVTRRADRYMPKLKCAPSDLERRQFTKSAFETIRWEFDSRLRQLRRENRNRRRVEPEPST